MRIFKHIILGVILLNVHWILAQSNDTLVSLKISELNHLFKSADYTPIYFEDSSLMSLRNISVGDTDITLAYKSNYLELKKDLYEHDYGLELTSTYLENFNPTVADLNDNLVYNRKWQAAVNWNVLNNGYFDNQLQAQIIQDQIERERLQNQQDKQAAYYLSRFDKTIFLFNQVKIDLLKDRQESLEKQYQLLQELVLMKKLPKSDLLRIESRLSEIESMINVYGTYNQYLNFDADTLAFNRYNLPLIDLKYETIFSMIESQSRDMVGNHTYVDYYKWYHQVGLKTFVRYNYYDLISASNRSYFSAGVNVSIPLPFNTKRENALAQEKWNYDHEQMMQQRNSLHEDVLNVAYEFRYKLKQFIAFYQKRLLIEEKLRIEKVKVKLGDNNIDPMGALDLVDDLVRVDIELLDLLQNMYLKSLKIHSKMAYANIDQVVKAQTLPELNSYIKTDKKGVYVWSSIFTNNKVEFLAEYCVYNQFNKIILAASKSDKLVSQKVKFIKLLPKQLPVSLMIGSNKLFYSDELPQITAQILAQYSEVNVQSIHLDIEPHTFENYKTNKDSLLGHYIQLVKQMAVFCRANQLELEISIPLTYPESIVNQLFDDCSTIYFMAYENVKTDYIYRKLSPYLSHSKQINVALRTEDFINRIELEHKVNEVADTTGLDAFTVHDLKRLIDLDRNNVGKLK